MGRLAETEDGPRFPFQFVGMAALDHRTASVPETLTKLAYRTMQQGKSLMGLAHKEATSRLMGLLAPEGVPRTEPLPDEVLNSLRQSMDRLTEQDWREAANIWGDGRVRSSFAAHVTLVDRLSSRAPNVQNLPTMTKLI